MKIRVECRKNKKKYLPWLIEDPTGKSFKKNKLAVAKHWITAAKELGPAAPVNCDQHGAAELKIFTINYSEVSNVISNFNQILNHYHSKTYLSDIFDNYNKRAIDKHVCFYIHVWSVFLGFHTQ